MCYAKVSFGQILHPLEAKDTTNIYYQGLLMHIKKNTNLSRLYVKETASITDDLPLKMGAVDIIYLTNDDLHKTIKPKKSIYVVSIQPIDGNLDKLTLRINDYSITKKGHSLNYGYTSGTLFIIEKTCNDRKYRIQILQNSAL